LNLLTILFIYLFTVLSTDPDISCGGDTLHFHPHWHI